MPKMQKSKITWQNYQKNLKNNVIPFYLEKTLLILSLIFLSNEFWLILRQNIDLSFNGVVEVSAFETIIKSAVCALGFINIALYFENALILIKRTPLLIALIFYMMLSSFWSINHIITIRDGLYQILFFLYALSIAIRYNTKDLSILFLLAGVIIFGFDLLLTQILEDGSAFSISDNGSLGLIIISAIWAMKRNGAYRIVYSILALSGFIIAIFVGDMGSVSTFAVLLIFQIADNFLSKKQDNNIKTSVYIVSLITIATLYFLIFSNSNSQNISNVFYNLNNNAIFGNGFGGDNDSIIYNIAYGLGLFGVVVSIVISIYPIISIIVLDNDKNHIRIPIIGCATLMITSAAIIPINGLVVLLYLIAVFCRAKHNSIN